MMPLLTYVLSLSCEMQWTHDNKGQNSETNNSQSSSQVHSQDLVSYEVIIKSSDVIRENDQGYDVLHMLNSGNGTIRRCGLVGVGVTLLQ